MKYNLDEFFNREEFTSNDLVEFTKEQPSVIQGFVTVMLNSGIFRITREETKGIIKKRYFAFGSEEEQNRPEKILEGVRLGSAELESERVTPETDSHEESTLSEKPEVEWYKDVLG